MRPLSWLFLAWGLAGSLVQAGEFETANQLYEEGKFPEAKQQYEQLVKRGEWTANLFYNLGNTDFRLGSRGRAILSYERALVLEPAHPEAQANLALLRKRTGARLPTKTWGDRIFPQAASRALVLTATIAGWLAVLGAAWALTCRRSSGGLWLGVASGLLLAAYAGAALWWHEAERTSAIIVAEQAEARLAPADTAAMAEVLPAGSRVRILHERGEWIYTELPEGRRGWIRRAALEGVRLVST